MNWRQVTLLLFAALLFLAASVLINAFNLWSLVGNYTIPWFCSAMAIGICIVCITCLLTENPVSSIPVSCVIVIVIAISIISGIGMIVDELIYVYPKGWIASISEWLGFTVILIILFLIPKLTCKKNNKFDKVQ
jgi:hypothetical protein